MLQIVYPEAERTKQDRPLSLAVLSQSDVLTLQSLGEEDAQTSPAEASAAGDEAYVLAIRISERLQSPRPRIGPRRGCVVLRRGRVPECLMRTHVVEVPPPLGEARVLPRHGLGRRMNGFLFQGTMHPLMHTVLLRSPGANALRIDAQVNPPDRERRQAGNRVRIAERHSVVAANDLRQAVLLKVSLEKWTHSFARHAGESRAPEHGA